MTLGLRGKLFIISLVVIGVVGVITLTFFESRLRADLDASADDEFRRRVLFTSAAVAVLPPAELVSYVERVAETTGGSVVVLAADGTARAYVVSGDGLVDPAAAAQSPAGVKALAGEPWLVRRTAGGTALVEVAAPVEGGGAVWMRARPIDKGGALDDLRALVMLAGLVGLGVAVFMSGLASELMARTMRTVVGEVVEDATGSTFEDASDSGDDLVPPSRSFTAIAKDLQAAVAELAEERDRLETILEQMNDAVLVLDTDARLTLTNDAANKLLMMDDDDVGRPLLDAVKAPELRTIADDALAAEVGQITTTEFKLMKPKYRHVLAHAVPLRNDGGVVIVMHDVTEIRRLERVRRDFVANVSHELRTPVTVIRANAEMLLDGALEDGPAAKRFSEGIHRNAERLTYLIGDLLDLSRLEAGEFATKIKSVGVRDAVESVVGGLVMHRARVEVLNEVGGETNVLADTTGLEQILQNLLDNAVKYVPEDGHVWVRATPSNDTVRIEVQDDGPGIAAKHRRRIFERFYRIDPGRSREVGGTGLGLSIVKHLAERMGGRVGVEPGPERGALFWVELPRAS